MVMYRYYQKLISIITSKFQIMKKYRCTICGYIYDPVEGDPDGGINPGTDFNDIPEDWECPVCGVSKSEFVEDDW